MQQNTKHNEAQKHKTQQNSTNHKTHQTQNVRQRNTSRCRTENTSKHKTQHNKTNHNETQNTTKHKTEKNTENTNKGRLQKKNYKLGLLAQPKVGRCPEGV